MAIALAGAVVISTNEKTGSFIYQQKCEKCGNIGQRCEATPIGKYAPLTSSFHCPNCGNQQKLIIQGS